MTDPPALRDRLLTLRADTTRQLAEADHIEPGYLTMLAVFAAALAALDAELPADAVPADRAVLVDDGEALQLISYAGADRATVVPLTSMRALARAATRRLSQ